MDLVDITIIFIIILVVVMLVKGMKNAKESNAAQSSTSSSSTAQTSSAVEGDKQQLVEDIKATQTGRVVDQVAILNDLDATSPGYRQFCELVGTTQSKGGVTAPYSKRQVAYYDVRCYKVERVNGHDMETLVAQERSIEPFYFTDSSCDTKVHVSLEGFGKNVILVNSMNHIEGPKSDFSKALSNRTASLSGTGAAILMVANDDPARASICGIGTHLAGLGARAYACAATVAQGACTAFGFSPALAHAGAGLAETGAPSSAGTPAAASNFRFAGPGGPGGPGGRGHGGGKPVQGGYASKPPSSMGMGSSKPHQQHSSSHHAGSSSHHAQSSSIPTGLDVFLGLGGSGMGGLQQNPYLGGPQTPHYNGYGTSSGSNVTGALLNIGLSALLASMSANSSTQTTQTSTPAYTQTNNTFMGYRIVEDVVPLGYPVYCLGEIYKNGQEVYMGKTIGKVSQSYYFATKLEAEVLAHLQS